MNFKYGSLTIAVALLAACTEAPVSPEQQFIDNVAAALGDKANIEAVNTVAVEGEGHMLNVGQDMTPESTDLRFAISDYSFNADLNTGSSRTEQTRTPEFEYFRGPDPITQVFGIHGDVAYGGRYILTKTDEATALVRNAATGSPLCEFRHQGGIRGVAVSPDGSRILTCSADSRSRLWDTNTGELVFEPFRQASGIWTVAFSPDGARMLSGASDGTVQLRDVGTSDLIGEVELGSRVHGVAFSPDGSRIVAATMDKKARLFDANLANPRTLTGHHSTVAVVAFNHDGTRVVTGSHDNTARVWHAATGESVSDPMPHRGPIRYAVAFSPDGRAVVTGCDDRTVRIWDVDTSRPIGPALHHEAGVRMVAFTSDSQIRTGTTVGSVRIWDVSMSPLEGDVERITLWIQVRTGFELDSGGGLIGLDADRWKQRRARLGELGGPPIAE